VNDDEIEQERNELLEIKKITRRRRKVLMEQAALDGKRTAPEVLIEIEDLTEKLQSYNKQLALLKTRRAEADFSLEEAQYRAAVATEWETAEIVPTIASRSRMEVIRLQGGIPLERAATIEQEVRSNLALDILALIDIIYLPAFSMTLHDEQFYAKERASLALLERAILTDVTTAIKETIRFLEHLRTGEQEIFDTARLVSTITSLGSSLRSQRISRRAQIYEQIETWRQSLRQYAEAYVEIDHRALLEKHNSETKGDQLYRISELYIQLNRLDEALMCGQQAMDIMHAANANRTLQPFYMLLARIYRLRGEIERSRGMEERANQEVFRTTGMLPEIEISP
jgi:tetratricopeptide (TPR) repeat protein